MTNETQTPFRGAPSEKIPVGIAGATGTVGQRFLTLLDDHPWFTVRSLYASERSAGRPYRDAVTWTQTTPIPEAVAHREVLPLGPDDDCRLIFSALDSSVAGTAETELANAGHFVVSNAKNHRMDPDVPLVVPEVNGDHLGLVDHQSFDGGGAIVTNPNCSTIGMTLALAPLHETFGIRRARVVSLQAISGGGFPGVPGLHAVDNVVPFIPDEEDKLENEPQKILGRLTGDSIEPAGLEVSAQCNRVPVVDGHLLCLFLDLAGDPDPAAVEEALASFRGEPQERGLPSAPAQPVVVLPDEDRPQPRIDRDLGDGMAAAVGRVRRDPLGGVKLVALSHNTVRGAAGGALLVAEQAVDRGMVG